MMTPHNKAGLNVWCLWITGWVMMGLLGLAMGAQILFAVFFQGFPILAVCIGAVFLIWRWTSRIREAGFRILLRSFSAAVFLWPFIPHADIEWSSPFPPAGFFVLVGLIKGDIPGFEIVSIIIATLAMWLAGEAIHQANRKKVTGRNNATQNESYGEGSGNQDQNAHDDESKSTG